MRNADNKEDNKMTPPLINKDKLWDIARSQTKTNSAGKTIISRSDDSFHDNVWDEIYKGVEDMERHD